MCSQLSDPSRSTRFVLVFLAALAAPALAQPEVPRGGTAFDVRRYLVELDLDVEGGAITGRKRIEAVVDERTDTLVFDSGGLAIDRVEGDGTALQFAQRSQRLQRAVEASSGRSLAAFFDERVVAR